MRIYGIAETFGDSFEHVFSADFGQPFFSFVVKFGVLKKLSEVYCRQYNYCPLTEPGVGFAKDGDVPSRNLQFFRQILSKKVSEFHLGLIDGCRKGTGGW